MVVFLGPVLCVYLLAGFLGGDRAAPFPSVLLSLCLLTHVFLNELKSLLVLLFSWSDGSGLGQ